MTEKYDVITIGSGIGGLTAALTCARAQRSVLVLEAGKQFGGYINPFQRKRFHFDPGIHYIGEAGEGQRFRAILDKLGMQDVAFTELDPDAFDRYSFPDYEVSNCRGLERFRDRLIADFPHEADGLVRFFKLIRDVDRLLSSALRIRNPADLLKILKHAPTIIRWGRATAGDLLDGHFSDRRLRAAVCGPIGDVGLPPSRVSAVLLIGLLAHYSNGAYFPKGGSAALRDAYVRELERGGAVLKRNARVERILHDGSRVTGVRTASGDEYEAKRVISNAQASSTYEMVGLDVVGSRLRRKLDRLEHSIGSLCIFLGVDGSLDTSPIGSSNIWSYESTDIDGIYETALAGERPTGGSFFLTVPSNKDPSSGLAPPGKQVVEMVTMASAAPFKKWFHKKSMQRGDDYERLKEEIAGHYIDLAEKYLPGLRSSIEIKEVATPATNYSYTLSPEGNIYGPAHTPAQTAPFRFAVQAPIEGLLLCGASVISAGILPCASSGRMAGKLAVRQLEATRSFFPAAATALLRKALQ